MEIDINCDMGESYGNFLIGNDDLLFPYISSCNIACGFHGGDPVHIERTIARALEYGLRIGAHPGYPDLAGFGRRKMHLPAHELKPIIKYQIAAIQGMARSMGATLAYVKPHGALYNTAAQDEREAVVILEAVREIDDQLALMGLAGSVMETCAAKYQVPFIAEGFADRRYTDKGLLVPRTEAHAVFDSATQAAEQVCLMVLEQQILSVSGTLVPLHVQSICVHGDTPHAAQFLQEIDSALQRAGIQRKRWHT